jgi:hypothetical protein
MTEQGLHNQCRVAMRIKRLCPYQEDGERRPLDCDLLVIKGMLTITTC